MSAKFRVTLDHSVLDDRGDASRFRATTLANQLFLGEDESANSEDLFSQLLQVHPPSWIQGEETPGACENVRDGRGNGKNGREVSRIRGVGCKRGIGRNSLGPGVSAEGKVAENHSQAPEVIFDGAVMWAEVALCRQGKSSWESKKVNERS